MEGKKKLYATRQVAQAYGKHSQVRLGQVYRITGGGGSVDHQCAMCFSR